MLPKFLQSSYSRYKDDTNSFATWLLEAASKCGYRPEGLSPAAAQLNKGKGKSKNKAANASEPVQYTTTIKDLQRLADVVANSALTTPSPVLAIAKRAIRLRKQVTSWFLGKGDTDNDKRHSHFITTLEKVCETLEWTTEKSSTPGAQRPPPSSDNKEDAADIGVFLNKFAVLTVEEPQMSQQKQGVSPESQQIVKVDLAEEEQDGEINSLFGHSFFKALCLFRDLSNMRAFISNTWSEYRDKKIDLMNAALVTDGALQLARDLVQEVMDDWTAPSSFPDADIDELVFKATCLTRGVIPTPSLEIGLPYDKRMADVAEWCYLPTRALMESFAQVLQDDHLPILKKGSLGIYDPKANRQRMSLAQKFNEDKILLFELLPEFCAINTFGINMITSDSITAGLIEYLKTKKVGIWLSFASQILLDVHHIMRYSSISAFEDLRISGLRIQRTIDDYWKISKTHSQPPFWPKEGDDLIKDIYSTVDTWVIKDPISETICCSVPWKNPSEKHVLLSRHSILCGLSMFHLNIRMQSAGQQLVTQWYDVQLLAFLYNLVKVQAYPNLIWPDMEAFINIHSESHIFVGSRPKNASESLNRLELATGISSAAQFARDARSRQAFHRPNGKNSRVLTPTTTIATMLRGQYVAGFEEEYGIGNIDKVLDKLSQAPSSGSSRELQPSNSQIAFQRKWAHTRNISTLQLLALLKSRLVEEEPVILFNYFGMHKRCLELLRQIRAKEHHKFVQYSRQSICHMKPSSRTSCC